MGEQRSSVAIVVAVIGTLGTVLAAAISAGLLTNSSSRPCSDPPVVVGQPPSTRSK
jgi:hypothetical protein